MSLDVSLIRTQPTEVYFSNVTHNLRNMAGEVGIYEHLWRPEELNIKIARELIDPLTKALSLLKREPDYFKKFNPDNGWGDYWGFVYFVEGYLNACIEFPDAEISVSR